MLLNNQIRIFEDFLGDYTAQLTGSFIAKKKEAKPKNSIKLLKQT